MLSVSGDNLSRVHTVVVCIGVGDSDWDSRRYLDHNNVISRNTSGVSPGDWFLVIETL